MSKHAELLPNHRSHRSAVAAGEAQSRWHGAMDYRIRRTKEELDSTGFMEIGPGKYGGKHWQEGFLFIWEDAFVMAEGILARHFPSYDHFGMNDLPGDVGRRVAAEWREVAARLDGMSTEEACGALLVPDSWRRDLSGELARHRDEIAKMLTQLADACDHFLEEAEWVCILGI